MGKLLFTAAIIFATPSMAHYYNATFDCGGGQTVWIANPAEGHGAERQRKLIIEMTADFDRPTVVRFDPDKEAVAVNGRACHRARDD